jgi:hypothetical protein
MCFHDCNRDYEQKREQEVSRAAHFVAVKGCAAEMLGKGDVRC